MKPIKLTVTRRLTKSALMWNILKFTLFFFEYTFVHVWFKITHCLCWKLTLHKSNYWKAKSKQTRFLPLPFYSHGESMLPACLVSVRCVTGPRYLWIYAADWTVFLRMCLSVPCLVRYSRLCRVMFAVMCIYFVLLFIHLTGIMCIYVDIYKCNNFKATKLFI